MKREMLAIMLAIFAVVSAYARTPLEADPISIGTVLVDEVTLEGMSDICRFYNLTQQDSGTDSSIHFISSGQWEVKGCFTNSESGVKLPQIEIKTPLKIKQIEKTLKQNGYSRQPSSKKDRNIIFIKGHNLHNQLIQCTVIPSSPTSIIFTKIRKNK